VAELNSTADHIYSNDSWRQWNQNSALHNHYWKICYCMSQVHDNRSKLHINVPFHTVRITKNMAPIHMLVPTRYKVGPLTYPAHYWMYGWADNTP